MFFFSLSFFSILPHPLIVFIIFISMIMIIIIMRRRRDYYHYSKCCVSSPQLSSAQLGFVYQKIRLNIVLYLKIWLTKLWTQAFYLSSPSVPGRIKVSRYLIFNLTSLVNLLTSWFCQNLIIFGPLVWPLYETSGIISIPLSIWHLIMAKLYISIIYLHMSPHSTEESPNSLNFVGQCTRHLVHGYFGIWKYQRNFQGRVEPHYQTLDKGKKLRIYDNRFWL